ncbi:acetylxylan esterase [Arthrobacter sp. UYEF20]|uniref:acetylxylan esterase n=1 Tax=Arthrobacter sp. UYEF20 TaxID=1756363 RepID=UPI003396B49A
MLAGLSQGGGLAIAAAGLAAGRLDGILCTMADVPFLQDFPRAIDIAPRGPYPEIASFLARHRDRYEPALAVLNYFDGVHLGRRATGPALFSVAQMDDACPPSTVFAAFNAYGAVRQQPRRLFLPRPSRSTALTTTRAGRNTTGSASSDPWLLYSPARITVRLGQRLVRKPAR